MDGVLPDDPSARLPRLTLLSVKRQRLVDSRHARKMGHCFSVGIELRADRGNESFMRPKYARERIQFLPAHEQFFRAREEGNFMTGYLDLKCVKSTRIAVEQAKAGHSTREQTNHRCFDPVELIPALQLVS